MLNIRASFLGYCLIAGFGLSGCSQTTQEPAADATLRPLQVRLIDTATLGIQNVTSFDVYLDGQRLHAVFSGLPATGKQPVIGYLRSDDGGLHWSTVQALGESFSLPVEAKAGNDIQIAASGAKLLAMWQLTGELPGMGPLTAAYSEDTGQTWHLASKPTGSDADQSHHELLADANGRFHAVWLDDRDENGYQGVRYARSGDVGKTWELAQTVDDSSCSCCWNRLALGMDGTLNLLYRDMEPRDMALAQTADTGVSWQRLTTVGAFDWKFDGCPHNGGALSVSGNGSIHALVWTGVENQVGLYHLQSADHGKHWSLPQPIGEFAAFHSDLAAGADRLVAIWDALGPEGSKVYFADSIDNGAHWAVAKVLSAPGRSATFPRVVATPAGFLAMWLEQTPAGKQWAAALLQ